MSKMFEILGPLGLEWCFSKTTDSAKLIYEFKKQKIKRKLQKNGPTNNHYEPTMEPLGYVW